MNMKFVKLSKSAGLAAMMTSVTIVSAQNTLNISQPLFETGLPVESWAWQSITVPEESIMTTFGFEWNGSSGDLSATATVDLLTGEGTSGTLLASTTGIVMPDWSGPYQYDNFFVAVFGNVDLAPGQYTISVHDATAELEFMGTTSSSYGGGKFVCDSFGDFGGDATFFTPSPVPEPSSLALAIIGLASVGGYRTMKERARKRA